MVSDVPAASFQSLANAPQEPLEIPLGLQYVAVKNGQIGRFEGRKMNVRDVDLASQHDRSPVHPCPPPDTRIQLR